MKPRKASSGKPRAAAAAITPTAASALSRDARAQALVDRLRDGRQRLQKSIVLREDAEELFGDAADMIEFAFSSKGDAALGLLDMRDVFRELAESNREVYAVDLGDQGASDDAHKRFHDALDRLQQIADALFPASPSTPATAAAKQRRAKS